MRSFLLTVFVVLAVSNSGLILSVHGLSLHGIHVNTVSLNGSISCAAHRDGSGGRERICEHRFDCGVEIRCGGDRTMMVARRKTDDLGRFDFYFKMVDVPEFNPNSCDVFGVCDGFGQHREVEEGAYTLKSHIVEETIARTSDGAQAFFHANSFSLWSTAVTNSEF